MKSKLFLLWALSKQIVWKEIHFVQGNEKGILLTVYFCVYVCTHTDNKGREIISTTEWSVLKMLAKARQLCFGNPG